ncbi:MAG: NnrS family protein [Spongiibacteraceae bacterium]
MDKPAEIAAIWRQAFRPFFLVGSIFSILAIALWIGILEGLVTLSPYGGAFFWHGHEMLFGFVVAIVVGFLLTAVQNWTGLRALHGRGLIGLFVLWLAARLLMLAGLTGYQWLVAIIDISFLPVAAGFFSNLLIRSGSSRNYQIVLLFGLLTIANTLTHGSVLFDKPGLFIWGMDAAVFVVTLLMVIMGGRVIPLFTASGTRQAQLVSLRWLEILTLASTWLITIIFVFDGAAIIPRGVVVILLIVASVCNALRAFRWKVWTTYAAPLVWSLHLAYWFIPIGFALLALHYAGLDISRSTALHSLTAGAMGSLILAMIARVSLGHTGRPLLIRPIVSAAFIFIILAGITRILAGLYPATGFSGLIVAAVCWVLAYGIFTIVYFSVLTTPRADGKPG